LPGETREQQAKRFESQKALRCEPDGGVDVLHGSGHFGIALFLVCGELCHCRLESAKLGLLSGGGGNRRNAAVDGGYAVVSFLRGVEVM
jgi:hypothetical protein